ncbi:restriction endonuclease subunit S [Sphingobacterium paucimobilis]|nr:restriction endonuclease subunit S [Sphingobacterium paucimobilis]
MKQTEIGLIPDDWEVAKLGEFCFITKLAGFEYSKYFNSYKDGGEIIVVRGTNITNNRLDLSDVKNIPKKTSDFLYRSKLSKGDLVFAYVGTIGPIYLIEEDNKFHLGPNTAKIKIEKENVSTSFIYNYFLSEYIRKEIEDRISIGAQPSLSMSKIRDFSIPLPPLPEQQAIANALSDADAWIESLEQLIAKKRLIKQGAMQTLLTPKEDWDVKKLGDFCDIDSENLSSNTNSDYEFKYISLENVDEGKLLGYTEHKYSTSPSRARRVLRKGDILISTVRPNLLSHFLFISESTDFVCSTGFSVIRTNQCSAFIYYHFFGSFVNNQINNLIIGSNYPAINSGDVKGIEIPLPSLTEQTRIATILSDMDAELEALTTQLEKARQIKQGMMQELLTGRIRLL